MDRLLPLLRHPTNLSPIPSHPTYAVSEIPESKISCRVGPEDCQKCEVEVAPTRVSRDQDKKVIHFLHAGLMPPTDRSADQASVD